MKRLQQALRERLTPGRFAHVAGVVKTAESLARLYGADPHKAILAAWLHDYYREASEDELTHLAQDVGMALPEGPAVTWHGPICAARMKRDFAVDDEEVKFAVAYHTVGHAVMPLLARILYVADAIEPTRRYPGVEDLRTLAQQDLTLALARTADDSIRYLLSRNEEIALATVAMRNEAYREYRTCNRSTI
ncbi:MAG: bis(5'-nucleosyl)-tetraphosphatase (symmetrical) YqeK [Firmicutes bacterium]|nr:bis(5'-nucleosyl)-tetraphosphatase (symmetrical) YqeK [Bacillota bacterium]